MYNSAVGIAVSGDRVFVSDTGLKILNVSNGSDIQYLGYYLPQGGGAIPSYALTLVGETVFLALGTLGLQIIDVSTNNPRLLGIYPTLNGFGAQQVAFIGNKVFLSSSDG